MIEDLIALFSNPHAGAAMRYDRTLETSLTSERRKVIPKMPNSVYDVYETLQTYQPVQHILRGHVTTAEPDGTPGEAVLFSTPNLLAAIAGSTHVFIDGTFSVYIFRHYCIITSAIT